MKRVKAKMKKFVAQIGNKRIIIETSSRYAAKKKANLIARFSSNDVESLVAV